jgi:hypothetical protein
MRPRRLFPLKSLTLRSFPSPHPSGLNRGNFTPVTRSPLTRALPMFAHIENFVRENYRDNATSLSEKIFAQKRNEKHKKKRLSQAKRLEAVLGRDVKRLSKLNYRT